MLANNFKRVSNIAIGATICLCVLFGRAQIQIPILLAYAQPGAQNVTPEMSNGNETGSGNANVKRVILFPHDAIVQVAPDNQMKPGGVLYEAMTFNRTIPDPSD